ncbi:hypothetical protein [Actinoallomurus sp. NPDC050550]
MPEPSHPRGRLRLTRLSVVAGLRLTRLTVVAGLRLTRITVVGGRCRFT